MIYAGHQSAVDFQVDVVTVHQNGDQARAVSQHRWATPTEVVLFQKVLDTSHDDIICLVQCMFSIMSTFTLGLGPPFGLAFHERG